MPDDEEQPSPQVRVEPINNAPVASLINPSSMPKNTHFKNQGASKYNLRSQQNASSFHLMAQNLIDSHFLQLTRTPQGQRETMGSLLRGPHHKIMKRSHSNDWGRLAQGNDYRVRATDIIDFIHKIEVLLGKKSHMPLSYVTIDP